MKIFFLTQFYFDLQKPILSELEKQGHEVFLVEDKRLPLDPNWKSEKNYIRKIKGFFRRIMKVEIKYWNQQIISNPRYSDKYDLFFCIDGLSFHPCLLEHLKSINPNIKSSLYLWDTNKFYNFFRYNECFDRVLTFDLDDAISTTGVEVLHSYWVPTDPREVKYKLFVVGSDHDDRIDIISKVYRQLEDKGLSSFMRVVIKEPEPLSAFSRLFRSRRIQYKKNIEEWKKKQQFPFTSVERVPVEDVVRLIDESECILDTDMPIQTGATERVIWALARGKKIISTNKNLKRLPFYDDRQIRFIERNNPVVDFAFLNNTDPIPVKEEIQALRIDKWIHYLIDFN